MKRICVFCGSSRGGPEHYAAAAAQMGALLATRGLGLVYGGGKIGLMGVVADAALAAGGEVIGVIPDTLMEREVGHGKQLMAELSDGFIALPGGMGTMDELFEMLTWSLLGLHDKPCGLLNHAGYYDAMLSFLEHGEREGFLKPKHRALLLVHTDPEALLGRMLGKGGG